jgi:signal transduction histidine kinase
MSFIILIRGFSIIFHCPPISSAIILPILKRILIYLAKILSLAVIYHLTVRVGLSMAFVQANTSPVWPPTGIAIAALLIFGLDLWPGVALGVFAGSLLTNAPPDLALGITIGNTLEAVVAALILRRFLDFQNSLERTRDVVALALVSLFATTLSATIGTLTLMLTGNGVWVAFAPIWSTWWIGDLLGALVVAPVLLVWLSPSSFPINSRRYLEGALVILFTASVTWYVFSNNPPLGIAHQALLYVLFPFIIWSALRFGPRGAATGTVIISLIAIWGTSHRLGPFSQESLNDSLVLLQTFLGVVAITSLILAATTAERLKAASALQQKVAGLAALNDSSETFLGTFDQAGIYQAICSLAVKRFEVDAAWLELLLPTETTDPAAVEGLSPAAILALRTQWRKPDPLPPADAPQILSSTEGNAAPQFHSFVVLPLNFGAEVIGSLNLVSRANDYFTADRLLLLQSFTNLAAVAIQNSWLLERVRRGNEQLHALSQRLMKAQEEERLNLSRELHDESGQLLAALSVRLGLLEREAGSLSKVQPHLAELKRITAEIQDDLHKLAVNLRPASLDHLGLVTALQQFSTEFSRQYGIPVEFEATGMKNRRLPGEIETAIFRTVQESLTNVVLHARASRVDVLVSRHGGSVVTVVEDDGVGFTPTIPDSEEHLGLFGMRERIEMLGGKFSVESAPGKGTTVRAEVPCHD